jgi:cellulose synthase operon protein C
MFRTIASVAITPVGDALPPVADAPGSPVRPQRVAALVVGICLAWVAAASAQLTPDQMAQMVLDSAKKAYNEKNYPVAVQRFREFLAKFGNHKDLPAARYGLALALLDGNPKDYNGALEQLNVLAAIKDFPEQPHVFYYQGLAQRGLGVQLLAQAAAQPQQAPQLKAQANQRFDESAKHFGNAATAFAARVKDVAADVKDLPLDLEWSARSRCDQAEMQLRTLKTKEAVAITAPFTKGSPLVKSRYRGLGLYYHGFASFLLADFPNASRSLSQLAPFSDPVYGLHARYLLGRTHHQAEELAEAATHYDGVLTGYDKNKKDALVLLQQGKVNNDPEERARCEELVRGPAPDYVARSAFFLGVIQYEGGKFGEALGKFVDFPKAYPGSTLQTEAQLRAGFCQVQLREWGNALKTLQPLIDKEPRLADQALLWSGKALVGAADPTKPQEYPQVLNQAMDHFRRAAERSQQLASSDPEAKARRGEALVELADTQQLAKQYKEAANTYQQVLNEKTLPARDEEISQRLITALHLAGDYPASDQAIARFLQAYPKSTLLPAVLFRHAENAYFSLLAAEKIPDANQRAKEVARLSDETAKRYQVVIDKYPEFGYVNLARYGVGMIHYRKGEYDKAEAALDAIPAGDRNGDLAMVPYLVADCTMRLAPTKVDDAVAGGKLQEDLGKAAELLEGFVGADPKGALAADALLKLGLCRQRLGALIATPKERGEMLNAARTIYQRIQREFPQSPLMPQSQLEAAKCLALMTPDKNGPINELRRFTTDAALRQAPVAPMAILELGILLREQSAQLSAQNQHEPARQKAEEAAKLLAECRQQHEANLAKDPERASWVPLLQYHQAVALREANKLTEARALFDTVVKTAPSRPEAIDAGLRSGQCLLQEGLQKIDAARKRKATPNLKTEDHQAADKAIAEGYKQVSDAVAYFEGQAEQWRQKQPTAEARARMFYEAAWGHRYLAEPEVATARAKIQQDLWNKLQEEAKKKDPNYRPPAVADLPDVPLSAVPLTPAENKVRANYQAIISQIADSPLAIDARFELSELYAQRSDHNAAVQMLAQALDKDPGPELTDKIRLRLAEALALKKDMKAALAQFDAVANNPKSPLLGQAQYRAAECLLNQGNAGDAVKRLVLFRDNPQYQNLPNVTDRALLRLGHALAQLNQWDPSLQAHQIMLQRFPNSPWVHEARYGTGWAFQNKKDFENAVNWYTQVANNSATELGAKAQLQIGLCRLEQKRYPEAAAALLVVPFTYDYPELSAAALVEAARCYTELKQKDQAEKLLQRVLKDHPKSKWAEAARERLEALKKG